MVSGKLPLRRRRGDITTECLSHLQRQCVYCGLRHLFRRSARDPVSGRVPLNLYRFPDAKTVELGHFDKPLCMWISVSPDENWHLYTQLDSSVDDLMVVENFR